MSTNLSSIVSRGLYNTRLIDLTVSGFLPFVKNQIHSSLPNLFLKNALEFFENFDYKIVTTKVIYSKTHLKEVVLILTDGFATTSAPKFSTFIL